MNPAEARFMTGDNPKESPVQAVKSLRAVSDQPGELETLFRAHYKHVFRAAHRITGSAADAEDVLQTVFLRLIKTIIAPLLFSTLVVGIAKLGDLKTVGRVGGKAMLWFISASLAVAGSGVAVAASSPDVTGQKYSDAQSALSSAGLKPVVVSTVGDEKAWPDCVVTRTQKLGPNDPPTAKYQKLRVYRHTLGSDPEKDAQIFGYDFSPNVKVTEDDFPAVIYSPAAPKSMVGLVIHGVKNEKDVYVAPFEDVPTAKTPWKKVADDSEDITNLDLHGDDLFLLSHKDASRYKVLRTSLSSPDLAKATLVVPPSEVVIITIAAAADGSMQRSSRRSATSAGGTWCIDRDRGLSRRSAAWPRMPGTQIHVASVMQ